MFASSPKKPVLTLWYINIDPENDQFLVETNLPTPIWQGPTVNLLEGNAQHMGDL